MNTTLEATQVSALQPYRMLRGAIVFLGTAVLASAAALVWVQMRNQSELPAAAAPATAAAVPTALPAPASLAAATQVPPAIVINNQTGSERAQPNGAARQAAIGSRSTESKPAPRRVEPAEPAQPAPVAIAPPAPAPAPAPATPAPQVTVQGPATTVPPAVVVTAPTLPSPPAVQAPSTVACANCGIVESVSAVKRNPPTSGTGVVAGGVLGAVVGNQIGKGSGRTLGTILGAIGGGIAGNAVEKQMKKETVYQVRVRMEDGSSRVIEQATAPAIGSRINLDSSAAVETARQQVPTTPAGASSVYDASRI